MAPLATLLCWLLIAWLLFRDSKRRPHLSLATWVPTAVVFTLGSRNPSEWLGQQSLTAGLPNDVSGAMIDQLFSLGVMLLSSAIVIARRVSWGTVFASNWPIWLFHGYFMISALWSSYPYDSFIRLVKVFGMTIPVILLLLSEKNPIDALQAAFVRSACVAFPLSILFMRYYPQFGRQYVRNGDTTYTGVASQKNSFGEMLLVFILFLVWDHLQSRPNAKRLLSGMRWDRLVLLLMGSWMLDASQSKTSVMCLLIGIALLLRTRYLAARWIGKIALFVALSLPFLLFFTQQFSSFLGPILDALGRDATFTGRTDIWKRITPTTVNPLVGAGFWNFWGGPGGKAIQIAMGTPVPNAHDGYLDMYLDGGTLGLVILFCLLFVSGYRILQQSRSSDYHVLRFALLIVAIVGNLTETSFGRPSAIWFITLLALLNFPFRKSQVVAATATTGVAGPADFRHERDGVRKRDGYLQERAFRWQRS